MVSTSIPTNTPTNIPPAIPNPITAELAIEISPSLTTPHSLVDWLENPLAHTEWINDELVEKNGMTLKHSQVQGNIYFCWRNFNDTHQQGGRVYTEVPCRTKNQGRRPDVAYLTPELVAQYGDAKALPQSFPLIAEVASPDDRAEDFIHKAQEYLESGSEEVWLVFPECGWVIGVTAATRHVFTLGERVATQNLLMGLSILVDDLLA